MRTAHAFTIEADAVPRAELHLLAPHTGSPADEARAESRAALRHLVELLGQPAEWGDELEAAAFARGVTWRFVETPVE